MKKAANPKSKTTILRIHTIFELYTMQKTLQHFFMRFPANKTYVDSLLIFLFVFSSSFDAGKLLTIRVSTRNH